MQNKITSFTKVLTTAASNTKAAQYGVKYLILVCQLILLILID